MNFNHKDLGSKFPRSKISSPTLLFCAQAFDNQGASFGQNFTNKKTLETFLTFKKRVIMASVRYLLELLLDDIISKHTTVYTRERQKKNNMTRVTLEDPYSQFYVQFTPHCLWRLVYCNLSLKLIPPINIWKIWNDLRLFSKYLRVSFLRPLRSKDDLEILQSFLKVWLPTSKI